VKRLTKPKLIKGEGNVIYKEFKDLKLSTLGFGAMRFPVDEKTRKIDEEKATEMIEHAYNNGVNYFDTAFFYHGGESERLLGKALAKFPRDSWYYGTKFPGNFIAYKDDKLLFDAEWAGMEKMTFNTPAAVFEYQLKNCGVDYFDFYMIHNITESTYSFYTNEKLGIIDYLLEQKKAGKIKHLGISTHGRYETIDRFLNSYDCFEFALMQLNYLDWSLQEAGKKYELLTKRGVPVIVMEPVRGGKLADPGEKAEAILKAARPNDTPASWAFRFLQSLPNIPVIISGMTTMEQLKENIGIFSKEASMAESEKAVLMQVAETFGDFVPCTSCRYCVDACPMQLDIPMLLTLHNENCFESSWMVGGAIRSMKEDKKPHNCTGCGACSRILISRRFSGSLGRYWKRIKSKLLLLHHLKKLPLLPFQQIRHIQPVRASAAARAAANAIVHAPHVVLPFLIGKLPNRRPAQ
jgi:hypothetical protein